VSTPKSERPSASYGLSQKARSVAKAAALVAAPELTVPLETANRLLRTTRATPTPPTGPEPILIPPPDRPAFLQLSHDQVIVRRKRGLTIITVRRGHGLGPVTTAALVVLGYEGILASEKLSERLAGALGVDSLPTLAGLESKLTPWAPGGPDRSIVNPKPPPWNASNPLGWLNVPAWF